MSALGSRVTMTHRCTILRNAGAENSWGTSDADWQAHATDVPCRSWYLVEKLLVEPGEVETISTYHLALAPDTDVLTTDRIGPVTFRGANVLDGPQYRIETLVRWPDRVELVLKAVN